MVKSTSNTRVERQWVEVNARVTRDVKHILMRMEEFGLIHAGPDGNPVHVFCISTVTIPIINFRLKRFLGAFRLRRVNGSRGCVPDRVREENNEITPISLENIPSTAEAVALYEQGGGRLTEESNVGEDPLEGYPDLQTCRTVTFVQDMPSIEDVVADINTAEGELFMQCILYFIELTTALAREINHQ